MRVCPARSEDGRVHGGRVPAATLGTSRCCTSRRDLASGASGCKDPRPLFHRPTCSGGASLCNFVQSHVASLRGATTGTVWAAKSQLECLTDSARGVSSCLRALADPGIDRVTWSRRLPPRVLAMRPLSQSRPRSRKSRGASPHGRERHEPCAKEEKEEVGLLFSSLVRFLPCPPPIEPTWM